MSLEADIAKTFAEHGWTWNLKAGEPIIPDEDDILAALDLAAETLYDEKPGTQLEVGRLIIVKTHTSHDIYVYAGQFT